MAEIVDQHSLRQAYDRGRQLHTKLDTSDLNSSDPAFQEELREAIRSFTRASILVSQLGLFSTNETKDDIATADLKYLLLDAFLGDLYLRIVNDERLKVLQSAEGYFKTFLHKLERYELLSAEDRTNLDQLEQGVKRDASKQRDYKLAQYKREKQTKERLANLDARRSQRGTNEDDTEDDEARDYILTLLDSFVQLAINQLEFIAQEMEMLMFIQKNGPPPPLQQPSRQLSETGLKPIVIKDTRSLLQEQVFRPGWRQPTMTLDEFLELERKNGNVIEGGGPKQEEAMRRAKEEKEQRDSDADADAATYKAREWDEYTDDHRRGSGNQYNRS